MTPDRYDGNDLVRVLECYVLWCIGALPEQHAIALTNMESKLGRTFKRSGTWQEIISSRMEFHHDLPEKIRGVWQRNLEIARLNEAVLTPQAFAEMFVDENLR